MNVVLLMGNLTRDPEIRYTQGAEPMCIARYTLAINRRRKQGEEQQADFIRCVAFGNLGQFAEKYLHQGSRIAVEGRIQTGSYTDKNGKTVYTTDVIVSSQEFAESKASADARQNAQQGGYGYQANNTMPPSNPQPYAAQTQPQQGYGQQTQQPPQQTYQQQTLGEGWMQIPDSVDDEGLPWN